MVPDFGVFLPMRLPRAQTHSMLALVTFCLPVGLVTWWLFQLLVKPAWCAVLPERWRRRLRAEHAPARPLNWRAWVMGAGAVVVGAVTHLTWDSFTHEAGRGVGMLPFLDDYYGPDLVGHRLQLFRWLQHASSVLGLIAVGAAAWRWSRGSAGANTDLLTAHAELSARERQVWVATYMLVPVALLTFTLALELLHPRSWEGVGDRVARLAVSGLRGACVSLVMVSAFIRLRVAQRAPLA